MKGFWDKDKKCWIESAGGQAAYILQRMQRVKVREQRLARQAKAMQRLVPVQNLPFRSGLIEELPYCLDNDPWTVGLTSSAKRSQPSSAAPSMSWFDCKPDFAPPTNHFGAPPAQEAATVHVFPFGAPHAANRAAYAGGQQTKPAALAAPQWFEAAYASPAARTPAPAPAAWHGDDGASRGACGAGSWW